MAAGGGILLRADGLQKHLLKREPETQTKGLIAVIGKEPIMAGPQNLSGRHQHCFVPRSTDLEIDLVLALELDFTVVQAPRAVHQPVHSNEIAGLEPVVAVR